MDAIILAAGNSSRFGENKLLYEIDGAPMVQHIIQILLELQKEKILEQVVLVTQYESVAELGRRAGLLIAMNLSPELGVSHSISVGLELLTEESDSCLFAVADQPYLKEESILRLIHTKQQSTKTIAALSCGKEIGNPVIFDACYYPELKKLTGDRGGKRIVKENLNQTELVQVSEAELYDIDEKPKDFDALLKEILDKEQELFVIGAGGKTTTIFRIANRAANMGKKVLITTTTHMLRPDTISQEWDGSFPAVLMKDQCGRVDFWGKPCDDDKVKEVAPSVYEFYRPQYDLILIEADGAHRLPMKFPRDHEPALPNRPVSVLALAGLSAIGMTFDKSCLGKEKYFEKDPCRKESDQVDKEDITQALTLSAGHHKDHVRRYYTALTQWRENPETGKIDYERLVAGHDIARKLGEAGIPCYLI